MTKRTLVFDLVFEINILNDNISFVLEDFRKSNLLATSKKINGYDKKYKDLIDRFDVLNKRYLKWIETYNEKLLLIMLEQSSDIVLEYYSILCEIYGSVRYLLEDDLYYYCRNNNLQYKM